MDVLKQQVEPYDFHFDFLFPGNPFLRFPWESSDEGQATKLRSGLEELPNEVRKNHQKTGSPGFERGFLCKAVQRGATLNAEAPSHGSQSSLPGSVPKLKKKAPGHFWSTPPLRYDFKEQKEIQVGDWTGVEQSGRLRKPGRSRECDFHRLPGFMCEETAQVILEHCKKQTSRFSVEPDSVDKTPTFEYYPFQAGEWVDDAMRSLLEETIESRFLPYVRQRYGCRFCAVSDILVRRYLPGERRTHAVHFDGHAFVTAVLGLSRPDSYQGGLYIQPDAAVASRMYFRLEPGDLLVHSFDLQHGVHVWKGARYSLVFWIKDSLQAVRDRTTPWYDSLAAEGDPDALYNLAQNYEHGLFGRHLDLHKARELYERSAAAGHHFAQNNLGLLYRRLHEGGAGGDELQRSVYWLKAASEAGFAMAQKNLALAYANGQGVRRDDAQAVVWMRRAAEQLEVEAAYMMGEMYRRGRGVPADSSEAANWYQRSAEAGFPKAQYTLGMLYLEGTGQQADLRQAEMWLKFAARQGHAEAKNNVATMYAQRGEVEEASKIWEELAQSGEPNAQCNLGMAFLRGAGRDPDPKEASRWLSLAAAQGHQMAAQALASLAA
ncbi:ybeQ [Symbiodinium natans]|uniref:YbeQ protein n=1 Tax=Symbiodinium natans TaxID=878477 RepID=A0A812UW51_9DINO|nr:ybeQ [Symbiodinium natans]